MPAAGPELSLSITYILNSVMNDGCRVSDASGSIEYDEVKVGSISKSDLESNVCETHSFSTIFF